MRSTATLARTIVLALATAALGVCVGCGPPADSDDSDWRYGDAGTDSTDTTNREPTQTTFQLQNSTDSAIRVQKVESCEATPAWIEVRDDGDPLQVSHSGCPNCTCEEARRGECSPCAETAGCRATTVAELEPGASLDWEWPGYLIEQRSVDEQQCIERSIPEEGRTFEATFCWSTESGPTGPGELEDETCETVEFEYGRDTEVEKVVGKGPVTEPQPTDFVLKNDTEREFEIYEFNQCKVPEYAWVTIHDAMPGQQDSELRFETDCTTCNCEDVRQGEGCAVCAKACVEPELKRFPAGERETYAFDGRAWKQRTVDERTCHEQYEFDRNQQLYARFCWGFPRLDREPRCEVKPFEYGDESVVYTIQPRN